MSHFRFPGSHRGQILQMLELMKWANLQDSDALKNGVPEFAGQKSVYGKLVEAVTIIANHFAGEFGVQKPIEIGIAIEFFDIDKDLEELEAHINSQYNVKRGF